MTKKKKAVIIVASVVLLAVILTVTLVLTLKGADLEIIGNEEIFKTDYNDLDPTDYSALELLNTVYSQYCESTNYMREEFFSFKAESSILTLTLQSTDLVKRQGNKMFARGVDYGQGIKASDNTEAYRFYHGGSADEALYMYTNDKKKIPGKGEGEAIFNVTDWGTMAPYDAEKFLRGDGMSADEYFDAKRKAMTVYDFSKADYLSETHDDTVYEKDGFYYFTVKFNCSKDMMDNIHTEAKADFMSSLGVSEDTFKLEDTPIKFVCENVDGKWRFIGWQRFEKYEGVNSDVIAIKLEAEQTSTSLFYYDEEEYTITDDDLLK